jgi:hydrogenase large subunit
MVRGLEIILKGRDPRDAWAFCERVCGVCTTVHALASVRSVEDALGMKIPPAAELIRNIMYLRAERAGPRDPLLPSARARLGRRRSAP